MLVSYLDPSNLFFWGAVITAFGLVIGSFLNVVIYRLPKMLERAWQEEAYSALGKTPEFTEQKFNLSVPRSRCAKCNSQITALHNIPLLSFLWLRGKCANCSASISWQYPAIELLTATLSLMVFLRFGLNLDLVFALLFTWALIALAGIDAKHYILPDNIVLPLLWLGLFANLDASFARLSDAVLGAIIGYGVLWLCFWGFKLATGKDGMGYGDFKLMAAVGAWLGWQSLPGVLLLSSLGGAVIGIALILLKKNSPSTAIPFGPYIAIAGWLTLMFGQQVQMLLNQIMGSAL